MQQDLLKKYPIISDQITKQELEVILRYAQKVIENRVVGDFVEMGCYVGTTSLFLQRLLQLNKTKSNLYLYDSFDGLPDKTAQDRNVIGEPFRKGELKASKKTLELNFKKAGLRLPNVKKAWFSDLTAEDLPRAISFAFLDGDFYESIKTSLELVWPKMTTGAYILVDDYRVESLPGAERAVDEWLGRCPKNIRTEASLAIIGPF